MAGLDETDELDALLRLQGIHCERSLNDTPAVGMGSGWAVFQRSRSQSSRGLMDASGRFVSNRVL